jgi:hypothetical protein
MVRGENERQSSYEDRLDRTYRAWSPPQKLIFWIGTGPLVGFCASVWGTFVALDWIRVNILIGLWHALDRGKPAEKVFTGLLKNVWVWLVVSLPALVVKGVFRLTKAVAKSALKASGDKLKKSFENIKKAVEEESEEVEAPAKKKPAAKRKTAKRKTAKKKVAKKS